MFLSLSYSIRFCFRLSYTSVELFYIMSYCGVTVYIKVSMRWNFLNPGHIVVELFIYRPHGTGTFYLQARLLWQLFIFRSQRGGFCFPSGHSVVDSVSLHVTAWWILFPFRSQRGGFCFPPGHSVVDSVSL